MQYYVSAKKKDKNKKLCYVYLFICLVLRISLFVLFFSLGLVLLVWLSNFMITLIWFCIKIPDWEWATGVSFYKPLKFPETENATFCFIVVFVSLHKRQLHWRRFTFLKGDFSKVCYFHLYYFILSLFSILIFIHLRHLKNHRKILQKLFNQWRLNSV